MGVFGWQIDVYDDAFDRFAGSTWCASKPTPKDKRAAVQEHLGAGAVLA